MALVRRLTSLTPRQVRRAALAALVLAAALAAAYLLWLRDSSLVAVERTTVTGLSTSQANEIRTALKRAARGMTTLDVDTAALKRAVERYPEVVGVRAVASFPHDLRIEVTERAPVASILGPAGEEVAVAADGTVIDGGEAVESLPDLVGVEAPEGRAVRDPTALAAVKAAAAIPEVLSERVTAIEERPGEGHVATLAEGPEVILGDGARLGDKWLAAATAIADGGADDAAYVDVSVPDRPALGAAEEPSTSG
jgi:cell division protein FtsQ